MLHGPYFRAAVSAEIKRALRYRRPVDKHFLQEET